MPNQSLGTIEVLGLPAAVEAADVALKTADVKLIGYETTDGMGMVAVKIEGQVSAVQSAVAAACAAASRVSKVFATSVIPRPSDQLEPVVLTGETVGLKPRPAPAAEPAPVPVVETPARVVEPVETPEPVVETAARVVELVETPAEVSTSSATREDSTSREVPATEKPRATRTRKPASKPAASK